jgi:hypothetical protein
MVLTVRGCHIIGPKVFGPVQGIEEYRDIVMTWGNREYERTWKEFLIFMGVPETEVKQITIINPKDLEECGDGY